MLKSEASENVSSSGLLLIQSLSLSQDEQGNTRKFFLVRQFINEEKKYFFTIVKRKTG